MKKLYPLLGFLACMLMLLQACRTPQAGTVIESYPSTVITHNSKILSNTLRVEEVNVQEQNEHLLGQIRVANITQRNYTFAYRYRWLTAEGMQISSRGDPWKPVHVNARESVFLKSIAPTKDAKDFILDVRFVEASTIR